MIHRRGDESAAAPPKCANCGNEIEPRVTLVPHGDGNWDTVHCCSWECAAMIALQQAGSAVPPTIMAEWNRLRAKLEEEQERQKHVTAQKYRRVFGPLA